MWQNAYYRNLNMLLLPSKDQQPKNPLPSAAMVYGYGNFAILIQSETFS